MLSTFQFPDPPPRQAKPGKKRKDDEDSLQTLATLVNKLSVQVEKLESVTTRTAGTTNDDKRHVKEGDESSAGWAAALKAAGAEEAGKPSMFFIDPLGPTVQQEYENVLSSVPRSKRHSSSCCCESKTLEVAAGIPWLPPVSVHGANEMNPLQSAYANWCTLMRCLPMMDTTSQTFVRSIGLFAMRQLLHSIKQHQHMHHQQKQLHAASNNNLPYLSPVTTLHHSYPVFSQHGGSSNSSSSCGGGSSSLVALGPNSSSSFLKTSSTCLNPHCDNSLDTTSRKKADAWVPSYSHLFSSGTGNDQNANTSSTTPLPTASPQQRQPNLGFHYVSESTTTTTTSSSSRHHHVLKLRRWFKKNNKVAPAGGHHG